MAIVKKISELVPKGAALGVTDLLIVGVDNGADYDLKSVTGAQLLGTVVTQTITDGVTATSPSENAVFDSLALKVDKVTGSRLITSGEATILGNTSGTNTGDETVTTIKTKLGITTLSGSNTGDQDLSGYQLTSSKDAAAGYVGISAGNLIILPNGRGFVSNNVTPNQIAYFDNSGNLLTLTVAIYPSISELSYVKGVTSAIQTQLNAKVTGSGTSSGTNTGDQDLSGLMVKSNNLSDLTNTTTARSNLGLGSLATQSGTFSGTSSGTNTGDQTFLNARVQSVTSSATVTPLSTNDEVIITAQAVGLTLANPTGTFTEGQAFIVRIKDNGTAQSIAYGTNYRGTTLPTTTTVGTTTYLPFIYNSTDGKFDNLSASGITTTIPAVIQLACSDETTALTVGTSKVTFRMPHAMTLTSVRASLNVAGTTSGITTIDINESGVSILSTKLTIDLTEKTSTTAVTPSVISDSSLADDAEITIDIDAISGGATEKGLKISLIGTRTI